MRKAQLWSIDFSVSLVLFTIAALIAYTLITNTLSDTSYDEVQRQATDAARLLASPGYPAHWTNNTVIRAGILADDTLSLRKAAEITKLTPSQLRKSLRITDNIYVYVINNTGGTIPVFQECGVGNISIPSLAKNESLPAIAITRGPHPFSNNLSNITIYENDTGYEDFRNMDVIVLEGNLSSNSNMSSAQITYALGLEAKKGITFVIIGNPGIGVLGVRVNSSNASELKTLSASLGLNKNETLEINLTSDEIEIPTIIMSSAPEVANFETLAVTKGDNEIAYATWTYHDARIYYLATVFGEREDNSNLTLTLLNAVQSMIDVPRPICSDVSLPSEAEQVAFHDRIVSHHDEVLTIRTMVWRN